MVSFVVTFSIVACLQTLLVFHKFKSSCVDNFDNTFLDIEVDNIVTIILR